MRSEGEIARMEFASLDLGSYVVRIEMDDDGDGWRLVYEKQVELLRNHVTTFATSEFFRDSSDAEWLAYVLEGRDIDDPLNTTGIAMPPKGGFDFLTDDDINAIIPFLRGLQK